MNQSAGEAGILRVLLVLTSMISPTLPSGWRLGTATPVSMIVAILWSILSFTRAFICLVYDVYAMFMRRPLRPGARSYLSTSVQAVYNTQAAIGRRCGPTCYGQGALPAGRVGGQQGVAGKKKGDF
jgi:hypothetical protein